MASKRLLAVVTALILAGAGLASPAGVTLSHLEQIEQFIVNEDWALLSAYLEQHPELLDGDTPLAVELQAFVRAVDEAVATGTTISALSTTGIPDIDVVEAMIDSY